MSLYTLYHATDFFQAMREPETLRFPLDYTKMATVEAFDMEDVYRITQNQTTNWQVYATQLFVPGTGARSTSVGDVIVDPNGVAWRIASLGFERIDPLTNALIERFQEEP